MHAYPLEFLQEKLKNAKRCLDVGSGTGYLTLAFYLMMKNSPETISVGVEHIPELVSMSIKNISKNYDPLIKE
jgi:protein-L-isoaspartate(D-aspartate) O-methyltransferase